MLHFSRPTIVPAARGRFPAYRGVQSPIRHADTKPWPSTTTRRAAMVALFYPLIYGTLYVTVTEAAEATSLNLHHLVANG